MPYNNITSRTDAQSLIPEEVSTEMLGKAIEQSATLGLFKRVPVGRNQVRFPVLSALPTAYFVTGDTGLKQTTEVNWTNKFLNIEEIAVIMPVPDNVLADVDANIWDEAMPLMTEAMGRTLDTAVFFGTNAPGSWPTNIAAAAAAAGNAVTANSAATVGAFFGDIDNGYGLVEADGYEVSGFVAATSVKSKLRKSRDSQGRKLDESRVAGNLLSLDGLPIFYPMRGLWPTASGSPQLFMGDWSQFVVGVRQDITMKVLTEAVIQDNTGAIVYNLAQQDMTAVRLTFRVGWQVANTINNDQPTEASRYPVARLDLP
ncbi:MULTISPECIES: phage major capsid protein [unclassified Streptomyces]|uniref:phage major capsid protein n=1 Tax=unclassified Streptomyces TaxID=2593676 RepID=UPI000DD71C2A|nr:MULTISPECIES: phage major capsid protein [unclassified Streptomyces]QZZ26527.1 phage major capsid protein [Streptomyces sp. ST1015]